ncbi:hypothetical protein V6N13_097840 [Hibiscus sabdariffa]
MATLTFSTRSFLHAHHHRQHSFAITSCRINTASISSLFTHSLSLTVFANKFHPVVFSSGNGGTGGTGGIGSGGGGGGHGHHDDQDRSRNRSEAILALAEAGRTFGSLPKDLAGAIEAGKVPGPIIHRYFEFEKSPVYSWLLNFGGFKERLLADDLFFTKIGIECGVGIFTQCAAELEKRRERITKELDFAFSGVVLALVADFMLVWIPAPTVSLKPPIPLSSGAISNFFYNCPDNAFQVALAGTSYSLLHRIGAIVVYILQTSVWTNSSIVSIETHYRISSSSMQRNGAKLFTVGTGASLIGVGVTSTLINARKVFGKSFAVEAEDVPVLSMSVRHGVDMSVSSNLRYQIVAGVIEQRILEPLLHHHKIILSATCFAVRTGNTLLGSLM